MLRCSIKRFFGMSKEGLPRRFDDISLLSHVKPAANSEAKLRLRLRLQTSDILINLSATLADAEWEFKKQIPGTSKVEFYDTDMLPYHKQSLFASVAKTDFIIKLNNSSDLLIVSEQIDFKELFQNEKEYEDFEIRNLISASHQPGVCSAVLTEFISRLVSDLHQRGDEILTTDEIKALIQSKIQADALAFNKKKAFYDNVIAFLKEKMLLQKGMEDLIVQRKEKKAVMTLRALTTVVVAQLAFTQYGSYIGYSWDIIEPMVCLFGCIDIFCAYAYWYFFKINFDYQAVYEKRLQRFKERDQSYKQLANNEYQSILNIIEKKRAFLSSDPLKIIESFHQEFAQIGYGEQQEPGEENEK